MSHVEIYQDILFNVKFITKVNLIIMITPTISVVYRK